MSNGGVIFLYILTAVCLATMICLPWLGGFIGNPTAGKEAVVSQPVEMPVFAPTFQPTTAAGDVTTVTPEKPPTAKKTHRPTSEEATAAPTGLPVYSAQNIKLSQICVRNVDGSFLLKWDEQQGTLTASVDEKKPFTKANKCPDYMKSQTWDLPNHENYESAVFAVEGNSVCSTAPCTCRLDTKKATEVVCDKCNVDCKADPVGTVEMMDLKISTVKAYPLPSLASSGDLESSRSMASRVFVLWMVSFFLIMIGLLIYFFLPKLFETSHSLAFSKLQSSGYAHHYERIPEVEDGNN